MNYTANYNKLMVLSSYSLTMRALLSLLTLMESPSRSGFYLNSLHSFFVLSFKIVDKPAISVSIYSSSAFDREITFLLGDLRERSSLLDQFCKSSFIILLVFEKLADFEACEFTGYVVLGFN